MIFSVKSEARSELSLSRGIEVGRRNGCEGSSRGGRRTHCRGLGGGRGGTGGSRDQAEQLPGGDTALTPGLKHTCPTGDSGVSCQPPPFLAGVRGPFPCPAHLESSGVPLQSAATAEFHTSGRGCHPPPPRGPHRPSRSCHLLVMALQPGPTVLQAAPPLPEGGRALAHFPLWHTSTPSPLCPQLY